MRANEKIAKFIRSMKYQNLTPSLKLLTRILLTIYGLAFSFSSVAAQSIAPTNHVEIRVELESNWRLLITSSAADKTTAEVCRYYGFIFGGKYTIPVEDAEKAAKAIDAAVAAIFADEKIPEAKFGNVAISIGIDKGHKVIVIGDPGKSTSDPDSQKLSLDEASKFAKSLRLAPPMCTRLMSSIDLDAIWKSR